MGVVFWTVLLTLTLCATGKKKDVLKSSIELLEKEKTRLKDAGISCSHSSLSQKILDSLRISDQYDKAISCHVKYLDGSDGVGHSNQANSWAWSSLGQVYLNQGNLKQSGQANSCFKQALKLGSKVDGFIKQWHFLGPFVIGKAEVDGDPLEAHGGIHNVSKQRFKKQAKFFSELAPNGILQWKVYEQSRPLEYVQIAPQLNWNELVNSLGSTGITEWQGWAFGEFAVNDNNANIRIQCLGIHTLFINGSPVTGDVYRREQFWFSVQLSKGIHNISIRLRAKGAQVFQCHLNIAASTFEILKPDYLPDLYDGHLFSGLVSLPISNYHSSKWLKVIKVSLQDDSSQSTLSIVRIDDKQLSIAPGQTRPVLLKLSSEEPRLLERCDDLYFKLKITTSEEQVVYPLSLRCRKRSESFIFTFLDHDGSVQHAAAIEPLEQREAETFPVLLTLHGTTVPAQNQADSYKHMVDGKFVFGLEKVWVLAPTRHGAHNWEGPGALTAMTALRSLAELTLLHSWIAAKATDEFVIFAGHSMGGHGAWHLAVHHPDRALALVSLAGWLKKEEYGDSNLLFRHDIATSHVDPAVKAIMESCIAENEADRHVSNLWGISVMTRIGANDRTIHPYFARRMNRVLQEWGINVTYVELPGLEHWWWDTKETNDGGCVNDRQLRDFSNYHAVLPASTTCESDDMDETETVNSCTGQGQDAAGRYSKNKNNEEDFTYQLINPAYGESVRGLQILQQVVPFRMSSVQGHVTGEKVSLRTSNVLRLSVKPSVLRLIEWTGKTLEIDQSLFPSDHVQQLLNKQNWCLCREKASWTMCEDCETYELTQRGPTNLGPARRVAESPFLIVVGTQSEESSSRASQDLAVYIANLFILTSDAMAVVVKDKDLTSEMAANYNLIVLGSPSNNSWTSSLLSRLPVKVTEGTIKMGSCSFETARTGGLFLTPHAGAKLALVLLGNSLQGLKDVVSLATPTIPPMTRSPFSNMVPDFIVTGPHFPLRGPGGYLCAGFWGNHWDFRPELSSCAHCAY